MKASSGTLTLDLEQIPKNPRKPHLTIVLFLMNTLTEINNQLKSYGELEHKGALVNANETRSRLELAGILEIRVHATDYKIHWEWTWQNEILLDLEGLILGLIET